MKQRCYNPKNTSYHSYGGRGIQVCDRWKNSFEAFIEDMGERPSRKHSIERDDTDGGYDPDNCRWATAKEQALNKTSTVRFLINGKPVSGLQAAAEELGIPKPILVGRHNRGTLTRSFPNLQYI